MPQSKTYSVLNEFRPKTYHRSPNQNTARSEQLEELVLLENCLRRTGFDIGDSERLSLASLCVLAEVDVLDVIGLCSDKNGNHLKSPELFKFNLIQFCQEQINKKKEVKR